MVVVKEWDILLVSHPCFDLHKPGTEHATTNLAELGTDWSSGYFLFFYFSCAFKLNADWRTSKYRLKRDKWKSIYKPASLTSACAWKISVSTRVLCWSKSW